MTTIAWHEENTKRTVEDLVREVESKSSAELVVIVKPRSGNYLAADLIVGLLLAFLGLCFYVYSPLEFTDDLAPPSILLLFVAGAFVCSRVPAIRRLFSSKTTRQTNVRAAAREAFVDAGISCTRDRTGILLYVSTFERRAEIVADIGVLRREQGDALKKLFADIEGSVASNQEALETSLRALGVWLGEALPPRLDDTNELSDEVQVS